MNNICEISFETGKDNVFFIMGEVDIVTSETLRIFLENIVNTCKTDIIINCERLTYIDSFGINILVRAQRKMNSKGARVYLTNVNKNIEKLFSITHLTDSFKMAV